MTYAILYADTKADLVTLTVSYDDGYVVATDNDTLHNLADFGESIGDWANRRLESQGFFRITNWTSTQHPNKDVSQFSAHLS